MSEKERLERLQDARQAVQRQFLDDEDIALLKKAYRAGKCKVLTGKGWMLKAGDFLIDKDYYIIDPDWQPEPEFEYALIEECSGLLCIRNNHVESKGRPYPIPYDFIHLHCIPSIVGFVRFTDEVKAANMCIESISKDFHKGMNIYAQFVRQGE